MLPTDTMKNTVYALAAGKPSTSRRRSALLLARHFLDRNPRLRRVRIDLTEQPWGRIDDRRRGSTARPSCVTAPRRAPPRVQGGRDRITVGAGVSDLVILKSSHSAFAGFLRDEYTTLPDVADRLLATSLTATWRYRTTDLDFNLTWRAVRHTLLETFAEHDSQSVQHTLYAMGQAVLDNVDAVTAIRLVMPNKHHLPVDLSRLGLENRNEIFVPTDEPYGLIEATLTVRDG